MRTQDFHKLVLWLLKAMQSWRIKTCFELKKVWMTKSFIVGRGFMSKLFKMNKFSAKNPGVCWLERGPVEAKILRSECSSSEHAGPGVNLFYRAWKTPSFWIEWGSLSKTFFEANTTSEFLYLSGRVVKNNALET